MTTPSLSTYGGRLHDVGYKGQVPDMRNFNAITRILDGATALDFGQPVNITSSTLCEVVNAGSDHVHGFALRNPTRVANSSDLTLYSVGENVDVLDNGPINLLVAEDVTTGNIVDIIITGGVATIGSKENVAYSAAGAAAGGNTGDGTITGSPTTGASVKVGVYKIVCIEPAANAGKFTVHDPDGIVLGVATVGVAFSTGSHVTFTIADGATDFVSGDLFNVTVTETTTRIHLDGTNGNVLARFETDADSGDIAVAVVQKYA